MKKEMIYQILMPLSLGVLFGLIQAMVVIYALQFYTYEIVSLSTFFGVAVTYSFAHWLSLFIKNDGLLKLTQLTMNVVSFIVLILFGLINQQATIRLGYSSNFLIQMIILAIICHVYPLLKYSVQVWRMFHER